MKKLTKLTAILAASIAILGITSCDWFLNGNKEEETDENTKSGTFKFVLATTGNSNQTHYFDTSSTNIFAYDSTYQNVYYQIQFSYKGKGTGNWYLYMRDTNLGIIKTTGEDSETAFVAKGTYSGACFDSSSGTVAEGNIILTNEDGSSATTHVYVTEDSAYLVATVNNTLTGTGSSATGSATFAEK